jgi:hypothetical protein
LEFWEQTFLGADIEEVPMKTFIWLSFDLGVRGDFEGMYEFLDAHEAKECGGSVAGFWYEYKKDFLGELTKDLKTGVSFDKRSRVYVIFSDPHGKHTGKFIVGRRKAPPWVGFGPITGDQEVDVGA